MTIDIYLDSTNKDIEVQNLDLRLTTTQTEFIAQKIETVLLTFLREWWLNRTLGLPWFESILIKNPNIDLVNSLIQNEVLEIEEVIEIVDYENTYENDIRKMTISMAVKGSTGEIIEVSEVTL
jgi:hypothetical protein